MGMWWKEAEGGMQMLKGKNKKENVSFKIEQKLSCRHVLRGEMEEEETGIEGVLHNMSFGKM